MAKMGLAFPYANLYYYQISHLSAGGNMKYIVDLTIDLPRERVIELFDSSENMPKWQEGLQSFTHTEGDPGQVGAKSELLYDMNGRKVEMVETITHRELPDRFAGTYEAKGVWNAVDNRFEDLGDGRTRWVNHNEFRFTGFMKLLGVFMKGAFPKETLKQMNSFKNFAESEGPGESSTTTEV